MSSQNYILILVNKALSKVYEHQRYLISNRVSERSIVFWFGVYFSEELKGSKYANYDLDVEYNRNLNDAKRTRNFPRGTYPDLILHERGTNRNNILIMEFKTWWNRQNNKDIQKVKDFTNPDGEYAFQLGLLVEFSQEIAIITQIINGEG